MSSNGKSAPGPRHACEPRRPVLQFIQECAFLLKARDLTTATACALFHRCTDFLRRNEAAITTLQSSANSSRKHQEYPDRKVETPDYYLIATSCLLLAGKIEENHLNIRRLVNVSYKMFFKDRELTDIDEFYSMRSSILNTELWILRLVGFNPAFMHPHMFLASFLKSALEWLPRDLTSKQSLTATCWSILKDSYLSEEVLLYKPEHIAVGVLALGMQLLKISATAYDSSAQFWHKALCSDLSGERLDSIVCALLQVYNEQPITID